jgi:hypothetical protein
MNFALIRLDNYLEILKKLYLFTDHEKLWSLRKEYHGDALNDCGHGAQAEHVPAVDY